MKLKIGDYYREEFSITQDMVKEFAKLSGDYNPIHNHAAGETGLSFIFWTKVPDKMRNISAGNLYSASGKENGCTTFVGNSTGSFFDFKPLNSKVYVPKVGHFLIFPKTLLT